MILTKRITYSGQAATVVCDGKCDKAWGINHRPRTQLSSNPDDYVWKSDAETGTAPVDPGTYEGGHGKTPLSLNKWCVRECERCVMTPPGDPDAVLTLPDFDHPKPNIPKHSGAQ